MRNAIVPSATQFEKAKAAISRRDFTTAVRHLSRAESTGCDPNVCGAMRWRCWMLLGELERAWLECDAIAAANGNSDAIWDGRPLNARRILVRCLHGFGDAIQFIRYAAFLKQAGAIVLVETHPELVGLMAQVPFVDSVRTWAGNPVARCEWDQQIEVMEFPYAFRTTQSTIPAPIPYVTIDRALVDRSATRLRIGGNRPAIGLVWASSGWNPIRSIPVEYVLPLLSADAAFYSFQRGSERGGIKQLARCREVFDTAICSRQIEDTAADLLNMDLLITVDTMAAHLAGALGRKTWLLLPFDADWRWMANRDDSPWYPTMRLFRQSSPDEWNPVIDRVRRELRQLYGHVRSVRE